MHKKRSTAFMSISLERSDLLGAGTGLEGEREKRERAIRAVRLFIFYQLPRCGSSLGGRFVASSSTSTPTAQPLAFGTGITLTITSVAFPFGSRAGARWQMPLSGQALGFSCHLSFSMLQPKFENATQRKMFST